MVDPKNEKDETWRSYESSANAYAKNVAPLYNPSDAARFLSLIPPTGSIIDIGCGSGRDAKVFSEMGYQVLGIDYSPNMIEIAKATAPLAHFQVQDIQSLDLDTAFDGAWANASLLHIPKSDIPRILAKIHGMLNPNGVFFLKLKKGEGEGLETDHRYGNIQKFFSYFKEDELQKFLLDAQFEILDLFTRDKESSYHTHPFIQAFCKKALILK
jgi:SAM-dependent methyltransferase